MTRASTELSYEQYVAKPHRPGLDGLRGIGFLLVITAHIPVVPFFMLLQGWAAVWIFLIMSGYLITMLLMREEERAGRIAFGPFLIKRFFRIVPSYWAAILIYWFACYAFEPSPGDYEAFMARLGWFLTFLPEYANKNGYSIFTHAWTVGVELKFYLFFPPVLFLAIRNANARFAVAAVATALLTVIGTFHAQSYCAILYGVMLAFVLERPRGYALIARLTRVPVAVPLGLVIALIVLLNYTEQLTVLAVVSTYVMAYIVIQPQAMARVLDWRPLVYLGQRSYGAYLLHFLAIRIGYMIFGNDTVTAGLVTAVFCLVVTIPATELMYRAIEEPAVELGKRLLKRMGPVAAR
jgi:peptidoglycan/LPS O-acetylase OafA/YrhL